jgi:hypothetical protein
MARPKKDGHFLNLYLDNTLYENLEQFSKMSNMTKTAIIEQALSSYLGAYTDSESKRIRPVEAYYLKGASEYERQVAQNEGREILIEKEPCFVLEKTVVFGTDYYKIYDGTNIRKVPVSMIELV